MSLLSQRLASQTDEAALVEARRRNYLELDDRLRNTSGYEPVFSELPEEACPLVLPIWVSERTLLQNKLSEIGIETYRFGAKAHDLLAHAHASDMLPHRNNILCLPVHQQLSARDIEFRSPGCRSGSFPCMSFASQHQQSVLLSSTLDPCCRS